MATIRKKLKYPTDMTDEEWSVTEPMLPATPKRGRPRTTDLREVVKANRYLVRTDGPTTIRPAAPSLP
jgi:putative transposase